MFSPVKLPGINLVLFSLLIFYALKGFSQNLVPNPSFEDIVSCPTMESQIYLAEPWFQPIVGCDDGNVISCSSSDLYNSCFNPPTTSILNVDVPLNDFGFQHARTGMGYAGISVWVNNGSRERLEVELTSPLLAGRTYCVSMYVVNKTPISESNQSEFTSSANLNFHFSIDSLLDTNPFGANYYTPSLLNTSNDLFNDTTNWVRVYGCYQASGGEKFLTIGNFYDNINSIVAESEKYAAYYFIDDVSVEESNAQECGCNQEEYNNILPNVFTPNEDTNNDLWTTKFINDTEYVIIHNRWGSEIIKLTISQPIWNGEIMSKKAEEGVYFYRAYLRGEYKTGLIHLIR